MNIRLEIEESIQDNEIVIRCPEFTSEIQKLHSVILDALSKSSQLSVTKGDMEYYLALDDILFFETDGSMICVHTRDQVYFTKYKLYELEDILPGYFMRISKSSIVNVNKIHAIDRGLTSASQVQFQGTHKKVYVSRNYYKALKTKIEEKRIKQ